MHQVQEVVTETNGVDGHIDGVGNGEHESNGAAKLGWRLELHLLAAEPLVALLALEHLLDLALEVLLDLLHCGTVIRLPRLKLGLI